MKNKHYINNLNHIVTRILPVIIALFITGKSFGQQDPMYTQYMENLMTINPAYAGSKELLSMLAVSRNQWAGMAHAPETRTIAMHSPVGRTNMGLGLSFLRDNIWPVKQTGFYMDYSYTLRFRGRKKLALGLKGGVNFYEAGLTDLQTNDPDDPVFVNDINRSFLPNFGVGAFYHTKQYYLGLSVPKLIKNVINRNGFSTGQVNREEIHVFFMSGYVFDVNRIVKFKPSALVKYVKNAPVGFDFTSTFLLYDHLWLGAMYRLDDSFGGLVQLQLADAMKFGYSYDFPISRLGAFNKGTHEIMVSIDFNLSNSKVRRSRYF